MLPKPYNTLFTWAPRTMLLSLLLLELLPQTQSRKFRPESSSDSAGLAADGTFGPLWLTHQLQLLLPLPTSETH